MLAKRQIYKFTDYKKCQDASRLILWQYNRLSTVTNLISNQSLYF